MRPLKQETGESIDLEQGGVVPFQKWMGEIFEPLINSIDAGVYVLDCQGVIKRVNKYVLEHYKWEMSELIGENIFELFPDLDNVGIEEKFKQIIREREIKELTNLEREDRHGLGVIVNLTGIPIVEAGEVKGVLVLLKDITEKRELESQVAEAEEHLQSLIDNANDIIYTLDAEGYITFLNKMGQEITGYGFDLAGEGHYTEYVIKEDLAKSEKHFRRAIEGTPQRYESAIIASDGRVVNVLINMTPIRKGEAVVGALGIARDITERNLIEAQLLQASKMAAIGELAAGVAHEINNPVAVISGTAEQLEFLIDHSGKRPEEIAERLLKHVEIIREQAERCKKITQGLLNFARRSDIQAIEVNVARLIEEIAALLESRATSEGKNIEIQMKSNLPALYADPHLLEQIFLNLINNGLDAIETSGTVSVSTRTKDGWLVIEVADDGIGIAAEHLKKIFDPFFTTKPIGKGTGLGLSICFGIVQRINGTLMVNSTPGKGTTFIVRLPLDQRRYAKK